MPPTPPPHALYAALAAAAALTLTVYGWLTYSHAHAPLTASHDRTRP